MDIINYIIIGCLLTNIILLILIYTKKNHSSQKNFEDGQNRQIIDVVMNTNARTEDKIVKLKEEVLRELYGQKNILSDGSSQTQIKIGENLSRLQTTISSIITDSLSNLQRSNSEELARIHNTTKHNFDIISTANDKKLTEIQGDIERRMNDNLNQNLKSFEEVSVKLGAINKSAENMIQSTASIDRLNDIFAKGSVKQYGTFAEEYLQNLLEHHLPTLWKRQVKVPGSNELIDFTIDFQDVSIGIDSKFPLDSYENYTKAPIENQPQALKTYLRAIKDMATSISTKYGQYFDHILMYLPSDSMYNEVAHDRQTLDALNRLKIVPISPTTILTVIYAISIMRTKLLINENAIQMQQNVSRIEKSLGAFKEEYRKLGDKIKQAQQNYDTVDHHVKAIDKEVSSVKNLQLENITEQEEVLGELLV